MRRAADYNAYLTFAFLYTVLMLVGILLAASVAKAAVPVQSGSTPSFAVTLCSGERFIDVCPGEYFYTAVLSLNDSGIVSGYTT